MKRFFPVFLFVILFGCQPKVKKTAILEGEILNPNNEFVVVYNKSVKDTAWLDSLNSFSLELELNEAAYFTFNDGNETSELYLSPGNELSMTLNTEEFDESISYKGKGEIPNNYLAGKFLLNEKMVFSPGKDLYLKNMEDFSKQVDSVKDVRIEYLKKELGPYPDYADFMEQEKSRAIFEWAYVKNNYPSYHRYYTKKEDFEVDDDYYDFMDEIDLNNPKCINVPEYQRTVEMYVRHFTSAKYNNDTSYQEMPLGYYYLQIQTIDDKIEDPAIKEMIMKDMIMDVVNYEDITKADSILNIFFSRCSDTSYNYNVKQKVDA
jgi:hypothetical protein